MHVYVCLLACCVLCPLWACACRSLGPLVYVVTSVPPWACLDVSTCEIHLSGIGVLSTQLSLLYVVLLCLPNLLYATHLAFFASLHLCTLAYMFMHESVYCPYSNPMELWTLDPNLHSSP